MANIYGASAPTGTTGNDTGPIALITNFESSVDGTLTHFRYYTPANITSTAVTVRLFDIVAGFPWAAIVEQAVTLDPVVGWHTYELTTPIELVANNGYQLSIEWATGNSAYTARTATMPFVSGNFTVTDVGFRTGGSTSQYASDPTGSEFYVDVELDDGIVPTLEFTEILTNDWTVVGSDALTAISDDDDATYLETSLNPVDEILPIRLPGMEAPVEDLVVRVRVSSVGTIPLIGTLYDATNTTLLATSAEVNVVTSVPEWVDIIWSAASIASITTWTDGLVVRLIAG